MDLWRRKGVREVAGEIGPPAQGGAGSADRLFKKQDESVSKLEPTHVAGLHNRYQRCADNLGTTLGVLLCSVHSQSVAMILKNGKRPRGPEAIFLRSGADH